MKGRKKSEVGMGHFENSNYNDSGSGVRFGRLVGFAFVKCAEVNCGVLYT